MKKFWIKREKPWGFHQYNDYLISRYKKSLLDDGDETEDSTFCSELFEKATGLKLKPGEIVQCELKIIKKG